VEVQAQNDELQLNALKDAVLTSSAGKITIAAKEEILITCKGAYIKLANGEVEIGSPKLVRVKAPMEVTGASSFNDLQLPIFLTKELYDIRYEFLDKHGNPYINADYIAFLEDYQVIRGKTDKNGLTQIFYSNDPKKVKVHLIQGTEDNI